MITADGLTSDPTVRGTVGDTSGIAAFRAGLDTVALADFANVLSTLEGGSFTLGPLDLDVIAGGSLADGPHTLHLAATDAQGNQSSVFDVAFILDTIAPLLQVNAPGDGATIEPGARLTGVVDGTGSALDKVAYRFDVLASQSIAVGSDGAFDQVLAVAGLSEGPHTLVVSATDRAGNASTATLALALTGMPFVVRDHMPLDGADGVGIGVRPKIVFSEAVDPATLTDTTFFATAAGTALPTTVVVDPSGLFARLFFGGPMPGGAAVQVTVDGSAILAAADGVPLDADGDGVPGGVLTFDFTTLSTVALPGTTLSGRLADAGPDLVPLTADDTLPGLDGTLGTGDDVVLIPVVGARIFVRGLEDDFVLTGADGSFHFDAVPGGPVTLALRGETAVAPAGFTYPELTADVRMTVGAGNALGTVYMPRLASEVVQTVDTSATTVLTLPPEGAPGLTEEQRQQFTLEIAAGGLLGPDGQPVATAQVVMSVVPPGTLAPFLPPTLPEPTFAFTTQLRGATDLAAPFRATFPNVSGAPLGTEFMVLSFDPATGHLVQDGTATVVARRRFAAPGDGRAAEISHSKPRSKASLSLRGVRAPSPPSRPASTCSCRTWARRDRRARRLRTSVEIKPIPGFSGLDNQLFTRDDGASHLSFANLAQPIAPTAAPARSSTFKRRRSWWRLHVDGPAGAFLEGLQSHVVRAAARADGGDRRRHEGLRAAAQDLHGGPALCGQRARNRFRQQRPRGAQVRQDVRDRPVRSRRGSQGQEPPCS